MLGISKLQNTCILSYIDIIHHVCKFVQLKLLININLQTFRGL